MDLSVIDDTAHRAAAAALPMAEAVAEAMTGVASSAISGVNDVLSASPAAVSAASAATAGVAGSALRIARQHPYIVAAGAAAVVGGSYMAWRRRSAASATPATSNSAVRLSDVKAAA